LVYDAKGRGAFAAARVAILLASADFMASEFIQTNELPQLLAAAENAGIRIVPIILKPCRFDGTNGCHGFRP